MTLARLLAAALVFCSLPAFAQRLPGNVLSLPCRPSTPAEPWRIFPDRSADMSAGQTPLNVIRADEHRFERGDADCVHLFMWNGHSASVAEHFPSPWEADQACYMIRSYVVARDSKDSDSTHPVSYSTCQPSERYRLKSADMRVGAESR